MAKPDLQVYLSTYVINDDSIPINYVDDSAPGTNVLVVLQNQVVPFEGGKPKQGSLNLQNIPLKDVPKCFTPTLMDEGFNTIVLTAWDKDDPPVSLADLVRITNSVRVVASP
jgi:hypothetical protein